ncbi:MAG TPA: TrmJ/YjtD family RNA methyltransferase [Gemmatimonadaceae bacterium]|nr:TrmJ/YjtD family RNA methyltransferase [Gemmatimonadaceae bacterium]
MTHSRLAQVRVVLYEPQDPVNIAATVRAMKNMGLGTLHLVRPVAYDPHRLEGIAHGTRDLIDRIASFDDFESAVAGCVRVVGFTARRRAARRAVTTPREEAVATLDAAQLGPVALVFGREDSGLPNEILDRVHAAVMIPTTEHASLNLAQAVLVALYELHLAAQDATRAVAPPRKAAPPATPEQLEQYFADTERALAAIEFFKTRVSEHIMRTVRSLTYRAEPDARELSLIRAMAIEVVKYLERTGRS